MHKYRSGLSWRRSCWPRITVVGWGLVVALVAGSLNGADSPHPAARTAPGFFYNHETIPAGPWSVHIVKVDRANHDFEIQTTLARGTSFGLSTLSDQIRLLPREAGRAVAGINGDYYRREDPYLGDPQGLQILRGELISGPCDWTCFWIDPQGTPHMDKVVPDFQVTWPNGEKTPFGLNEPRSRNEAVLYTRAVGRSTQTTGGREYILERNGTNAWLPLRPGETYSARVREIRNTGDSPVTRDGLILSAGRQLAPLLPTIEPGAVLQLSTATTPDLKGVRTALGGGPEIVHEGKRIPARFSPVRHPRVAFGWNKDSWFLVEVDGRQRNLSVGMTMREWADYLVKLGCGEAMNLDGGGSSTLWAYGQIMNSPSEGEERGMGNALIVVQKDRK